MPVIPDPIPDVDFYEEEYRIPVVLLLDKSYSMTGAFDQEQNRCLVELSKALGIDMVD